MRLNLYTAAACSLLAYGIEAINLSSTLEISTEFENYGDAVASPASLDTILAQTYLDEYAHDLAQTYSELDTGDSTKESLSDSDKHDKKHHEEVTKCAKIPAEKTHIKLHVPAKKTCNETKILMPTLTERSSCKSCHGND